MQRLLRRSPWDADAVRDDVLVYVVDRLGDGGVLIVDETGFVKKGSMSAGGATPVHRHSWPDREPPGRRVPRPRH